MGFLVCGTSQKPKIAKAKSRIAWRIEKWMGDGDGESMGKSAAQRGALDAVMPRVTMVLTL